MMHVGLGTLKVNAVLRPIVAKTEPLIAVDRCDDVRRQTDQFARLDPVWTERFMAMAMTPIAKGVLDPKVYEFLAIAVDASCTHMYAPGVRRHIRKALELGATKEEILAVLQCVSVL